jgi:hypothetical protein
MDLLQQNKNKNMILHDPADGEPDFPAEKRAVMLYIYLYIYQSDLQYIGASRKG